MVVNESMRRTRFLLDGIEWLERNLAVRRRKKLMLLLRQAVKTMHELW